MGLGREFNKKKTSEVARASMTQHQFSKLVSGAEPILDPIRRFEKRMDNAVHFEKDGKRSSLLSTQEKQKVKKVLGEIAEEVYQSLMFSSIYR